MTWDEIRTGWDTYKENAKRAWPQVPAGDIEATGGDREALISRVQEDLDFSREAAGLEVDNWAETLNG